MQKFITVICYEPGWKKAKMKPNLQWKFDCRIVWISSDGLIGLIRSSIKINNIVWHRFFLILFILLCSDDLIKPSLSHKVDRSWSWVYNLMYSAYVQMKLWKCWNICITGAVSSDKFGSVHPSKHVDMRLLIRNCLWVKCRARSFSERAPAPEITFLSYFWCDAAQPMQSLHSIRATICTIEALQADTEHGH